MRFTPLAVPLCLTAALLAARASAGPISPLLEGSFAFASANDVDRSWCLIEVDGGGFVADGEVSSVDDSLTTVTVVYTTAEPTSISRTMDKLAIKQSEFAQLSVSVGASNPLVHVPIEKCSISSSFSESKSKGSVSLHCKGDDLSGLLSTPHIASVQQAMAGLRDVTFKVTSLGTKWSLSIACAGAWQP